MQQNLNLKSNVKKAIQTINGNGTKFDKIYRFTNENIKGYIRYFDLKDKSLLTVGSSVDQSLNAAYVGCRDITIYDLCPFVKDYYNLKTSAIMGLDYSGFLKYLCEDIASLNEYLFDPKLFNQIKPVLYKMDVDSYNFWSELYHGGKHYKLINNLFQNQLCKLFESIDYNLYLQSPHSYTYLKNILPRVKTNIMVGDILNLPYMTNRKFDNIFLSNIYDHIKDDKYSLMNFKIALNNLKNNLNDGGSMLITYSYGSMLTEEEKLAFTKVLDNLSFIPVDNFNNNGNKSLDSVAIYRKTK